MNLLGTIDHHTGLRKSGRTIVREAVRGVIMRDDRLLMVFVAQNGDYKFPGGGIQEGESHEAALRRELLEECGARMTAAGRAFGKVIEYDIPNEPAFDVFRMTSYYYLCQIDENLDAQNLDDYERDLEYKPVWVDLSTAIKTNEAVLRRGNSPEIRWTRREVFVLRQVEKALVR